MKLEQMTDIELSDVREWNIERGLAAQAYGDKARIEDALALTQRINTELQRRIDLARLARTGDRSVSEHASPLIQHPYQPHRGETA